MKLIVVTTALTLAAATAFAQSVETDYPTPPKPELSFLEAATIAATAAKGDLVAMELSHVMGSEAVYVADLEADTSFARVMIDGDSGVVLAKEGITAASEDALYAYMENFSTQAEMSEIMEVSEQLEALLPEFHDMAEEDAVDEAQIEKALIEEALQDIDRDDQSLSDTSIADDGKSD